MNQKALNLEKPSLVSPIMENRMEMDFFDFRQKVAECRPQFQFHANIEATVRMILWE